MGSGLEKEDMGSGLEIYVWGGMYATIREVLRKNVRD